MTNPSQPSRLLRHRNGHHARVTNEELFFDLVYAFAVTQLSHALLHDIGARGAIQTAILWFAVWLGWQYACWVTNWFDPERPRIRAMLFATMVIALVMAAAIPDAFGRRGLVFAGCYAAMQVGRTGFVVLQLGPTHPLAANFRRILAWVTFSAMFWITGGLETDVNMRTTLWAVAVGCEYLAPMFGFPVPGLGHSQTQDWTIEGAHLAERCQSFVIVALGESLLATGATLGDTANWNTATLAAMGATFLGTLAMWWLYFGTSGRDAMLAITRSDDPGRIGALFHYIHAVLVAGIIVAAVGNDLAMDRPLGGAPPWHVAVVLIGPALYLGGSAAYKFVVNGTIPGSHVAGALALVLAVPVGLVSNLLFTGWVATAILLAVGSWEQAASVKIPTGRAAPD